MTDELRIIWRIRIVLQLLAAFAKEEEFADIAGGLDGIADMLWKAVRS